MFYVARNGYNNLFLKVAPSAFVDVDSIGVGALAVGNVVGLQNKDAFAKGETILSIKDRTGALLAVTSPCDCQVMARSTAENALVREGDILFRLAPHDAKPFIRAKIDSGTMMKLKPATTVDVIYQDGGRVAYTLEARAVSTIDTPQALRDVTGIDIRVETGRDDLPVKAVGETARVVFDTSPLPWLRRLLLL